MTPEQYRALADDWQQQLLDAAMTQAEKDKRERTVAALRAAADQLEAVRNVVVDNSFQAFDGEEVVYSDLVMAIVYPADTAPQDAL